jgi:hypothetical protein
MEEFRVREGKKISNEELQKLDRAKMSVAIAGPPKVPEVEGQMRNCDAHVQCPWCGHINRAIAGPDNSTWLTCGFCGGAFRV